MNHIGLALSGGGFRATLYHLGLARFLRDAGILPRVTHITAVSGGSILAAHMLLNWGRYNGSDKDFDGAANELLRFVRLDIRNRIVRRYPFTVTRSFARYLLRRGADRRLTRSGLLETYYEHHLYGEKCLYELPKSPELHLLATNITEGCLCSFTRGGLIMQRRLPGDKLEFERISAGLASVPLAVAASSAFPGFFPPIAIRADDIGASELVFSRQAFTDGGIFDNLGVRAFRFIERCWGEDCDPGEVAHREVQIEQLTGADTGRLANGTGAATAPAVARASTERERRSGASTATRRIRFEHQHDHSHDHDESRAGDGRERDDHRDDEEEARRFREEFGKTTHLPAAPPSSGSFDAVITSDAGGKLMVQRRLHGGGLIRTAVRSSDILMDRVWQLEKEIVGSAPGFLFAPINEVVEWEEDPHALAPVVQQQVCNIRTDLDRFSDTEMRALAMHGYCVARHACRKRPELFGELPDTPPWDPVPPREPLFKVPKITLPGYNPTEEDPPARMARELQGSSDRRIWSTLFDPHDVWTYAFSALVLTVLVVVPYVAWRLYSGTTSQYRVLTTIADSDADYGKLIDLMTGGTPSSLAALEPQEAAELPPPDYSGFDIVSDFHIVDRRSWANQLVSVPGITSTGRGYEFRHFRVRRREATPATGRLRFQFHAAPENFTLASSSTDFNPVLRRRQSPANEQGETLWEIEFDLSNLPVGRAADVMFEQLYHPDPNERSEHSSDLSHESFGTTQSATMWLLLPGGQPHQELELVVADADDPGTMRFVPLARQLRARNGAVEGWQLHNPAPGRYECRWTWQ